MDHGSRLSNIEVIIPTFNEEVNLPAALQSVMGWADAVHVVDSESTDRTRDIAIDAGAMVVVKPWLGYAKQKNWALRNLPIGSDWVFILDADEIILEPLRDELLAIAAKDPDTVAESGYYVNRYFKFLGKRIRHCGFYPSWNLRFFKRGTAKYEDRAVHEHMLIDGPTLKLQGHMEHDDRRGLETYMAKHNRYSTLEAEAILAGNTEGEGLRANLFGNQLERRRWMKKRLYRHLPAKWVWRFIYMYVFRLGVLDGMTGLRFCLFMSAYELLIGLKIVELQKSGVRKAAP
jgi:glycosyltransferase involved in cell wall biosynthesis